MCNRVGAEDHTPNDPIMVIPHGGSDGDLWRGDTPLLRALEG